MVAARMNSPAPEPTKVPQHGACLPLDDVVGVVCASHCRLGGRSSRPWLRRPGGRRQSWRRRPGGGCQRQSPGSMPRPVSSAAHRVALPPLMCRRSCTPPTSLRQKLQNRRGSGSILKILSICVRARPAHRARACGLPGGAPGARRPAALHLHVNVIERDVQEQRNVA